MAATWAVVLAAVVWFALLKSEFIVSPVPMWLGWLSMTAFVVWCALATVQVRLQGVLSGVGIPDRQDVGDGVLAVRRLFVDLLGRVRLLGGRK